MENRKNTKGKGRKQNLASTKNGDPLECRNYTVITLLNTAYEVFSNILYNSLQSHAKKIIGNYQLVIKKGNPQQIKHMHSKKYLKTPENTKLVPTIYSDAVYNYINNDQLLSAMVQFKTPKTLTDLTTETLNTVRCTVKLCYDLSEPLTTYRGLTKADALAYQLLNTA
jgi:sorting nexin-29